MARRAARPIRRYWPIALKLAELASERGVPSRAAAMLAALEKRARRPSRCCAPRRALAVRRGRRVEAEKLLRALAEAESDDTDALRELLSRSRAPRAAIGTRWQLVDEIARARPDVLQTALDRAELLEASARATRRTRRSRRRSRSRPRRRGCSSATGASCTGSGATRGAAGLTAGARAQPQNPELRAYCQLGARSRRSAAAIWRAPGRRTCARSSMKRARPSRAAARSRARARTTPRSRACTPTGCPRPSSSAWSRSSTSAGAREEGAGRHPLHARHAVGRGPRGARLQALGEVVEAISTEERDVVRAVVRPVLRRQGADDRASTRSSRATSSTSSTWSATSARRNMFADYFGDLHFLQEDDAARRVASTC